MTDDIPEWAIREFCGRSGLSHASYVRGDYYNGTQKAIETGARLIAQHEEEPVDPDLIEARLSAKESGFPLYPGAKSIDEVPAGTGVHFLYYAIKRGRELEREASQ